MDNEENKASEMSKYAQHIVNSETVDSFLHSQAGMDFLTHCQSIFTNAFQDFYNEKRNPDACRAEMKLIESIRSYFDFVHQKALFAEKQLANLKES